MAPFHTNRMLDSTTSCAAPAGATDWPVWYTPQSKNFPDWFLDMPGSPTSLTTDDVGYGTAAVAAVPGMPEVDRLTVSSSPTGGYFTLTVNGDDQRSHQLANQHRRDPEPQLNNLVGASNVTVTSGPGGNDANPVWTVTFNSTLGDVAFVATENLTNGTHRRSRDHNRRRRLTWLTGIQPGLHVRPALERLQDSRTRRVSTPNSLLVQAITWSSCPGGQSRRHRLRDLCRVSRQPVLRRQRRRQHVLHRCAPRRPAGTGRRGSQPTRSGTPNP